MGSRFGMWRKVVTLTRASTKGMRGMRSTLYEVHGCVLLFTSLAIGLPVPVQVAALPSLDRERGGCARCVIPSYASAREVGPSGLLIEYYVDFADGRGTYQAVSILVLRPLSLSAFAPVACP